MSLQGIAAHLDDFEVLADRELMAGYPTIVRLRAKNLDAIAPRANGNGIPYDPLAGKMMVKTASHLLAAGIGARYVFADCEEISVLLMPGLPLPAPLRGSLGRDAREILIRIVSEASAKLSVLAGSVAIFSGNVYEFPNSALAVEYFRWRQEQSRSRALDRYCSFAMMGGRAPAGKPLEAMAEQEKIAMLARSDIQFDGLPGWQLRGTGVYLRPNGAPDEARLVVDPNLPVADAYTSYLERFFSPRA